MNPLAFQMRDLRFCLVFLLLCCILQVGMVHAQPIHKAIDSLEIAALDSNNAPFARYGRVSEWEEFGTDGSGEGEEPPGYDGDWWAEGVKEYESQHFHTGEDFQGIANQIVKLEINSINGGAIPKAIGNLRNLRDLTIDYAPEHQLPSGIWSLPKLEVLTLRPWGNAKITADIGKLKAIKQLTIIGGMSDTVQIPATIGSLQSLERLNITWCVLPNITLDFSRLQNLDYLEFSGSKLGTFPKGISSLIDLDSLILFDNSLTQIPASIGKLQNLQYLVVTQNLLQSLPPELGTLEKLTVLDLAKNSNTSLPKEIGALSNLRVLDLGNNELSALPDEIGQLHQLEWLQVESNHLSALPNTIGELVALQYLMAEENRLSTLPSDIGKLQFLESIYLRGNPLQDLPPEIARLSSLSHFSVARESLLGLTKETWDFVNRWGTKIKKVPTEIAGKPLAYYLSHPQIDPYAKRYIQGDLALENDDDRKEMRDSLLTQNPETAPFYLYLFATAQTPVPDTDIWDSGNPWYGLRELAADYISNSPCAFISQVKNGPYHSLYKDWLTCAKGTLHSSYGRYSAIFLALQAKMQPTCGDAYDADLLQMVQDLKK